MLREKSETHLGEQQTLCLELSDLSFVLGALVCAVALNGRVRRLSRRARGVLRLLELEVHRLEHPRKACCFLDRLVCLQW